MTHSTKPTERPLSVIWHFWDEVILIEEDAELFPPEYFQV